MSKYEMPERLDVVTAPEIEKKLIAIANKEKPEMLVADFSNTAYVSSAGLRVMLVMTKKMKAAGGSFVLSGMLPAVFDVFKVAGMNLIMEIRDEI